MPLGYSAALATEVKAGAVSTQMDEGGAADFNALLRVHPEQVRVHHHHQVHAHHPDHGYIISMGNISQVATTIQLGPASRHATASPLRPDQVTSTF